MTQRNYGIQSRRASLRGASADTSATLGSYAPSDSILIQPLAEPSFERGQIAQALIDGLAVVFGCFFLSCVAASLPLAIFILLFVRF